MNIYYVCKNFYNIGPWQACLLELGAFQQIRVYITREPLPKGRLSTVNLFIKIDCFVKKKKKQFQYEKQLI